MKDNELANLIMFEITNFCSEECGSILCCAETDCVLYRIEQLVMQNWKD